MNDEDGAILVLSAILLVVLLSIGALVLDVGSLYQQRRDLQNGADAAALAVARDCSAGNCGTYTATSQTYATSNANATTQTVDSVCGRGPGLTECATPPANIPASTGYVEVNDSSSVSYSLARVMGYTSGTVRARAVAAWGGPASLTSALPLTISLCDFQQHSDADSDGDTYSPSADQSGDTDASTDSTADLAPAPDNLTTSPPTYSSFPHNPPYPEAVVYFHNTTLANHCPAGPSGADLPGGFGWLQTSSGCTATSSTGSWFADSTGRPPPNSCQVQLMAANWKQIVEIPVFSNTNGLTGSNGSYFIQNYAAFYLTGYYIEGQYKEKSVVTGQYPCSGNDSCISGYFIKNPNPVQGRVGGPSTGVTVINLVE